MDIRRNSFDLIRLFAAVQVAFGHSLSLLEIKSPILQLISSVLEAFPGVPIFFMISGFLITASYERNQNIKQYAVNRMLRIYPALWVTLLVSVIIISSFGYLHFEILSDFLVWIFCQLTVFQFYNPSFLRGFGVGVVNGALWTITVELQFYIIVPMLYLLIIKFFSWNDRAKFFWILLASAILINVLCYQLFGLDGTIDAHQVNPALSTILLKLLKVTIVPYLYCFLMGVLLRLHLDKIQRFIVGKYKFLSCLLVYFTLYVLFHESITFHSSNPFTMMLLALPVISFAFSFPHLSKAILNGNDFSYGIYIYHTLVINVFVCSGLMGAWYFLPLVIMITVIFSILSWVLIEKPVLAFKYNPLRKIAEERYLGHNKTDDEMRLGPVEI